MCHLDQWMKCFPTCRAAPKKIAVCWTESKMSAKCSTAKFFAVYERSSGSKRVHNQSRVVLDPGYLKSLLTHGHDQKGPMNIQNPHFKMKNFACWTTPICLLKYQCDEEYFSKHQLTRMDRVREKRCLMQMRENAKMG